MLWQGTPIELEILLDSRVFPTVCPNCMQVEAHIFLRAEKPQRGGLWIWCSNCKIFEHATIVPPSYWENDDFINKEQLCASPDYLETHKNRIDAYMTQKYRGLDFDKCITCMRYPDFSMISCPKCKNTGVQAWLENHCMVFECKHCGYAVVGGSYFAPCEKDRSCYTILVREKLSPSLIVALSAIIDLPALDIKRHLDQDEMLQVDFSLKEVIKVSQFLWERNILHSIFPTIRYSKLFSCYLKILL